MDEVILTHEQYDKIVKAVEIIKADACKRVDIDANIKVYEVKNVIRIDIKVGD